MLNITDLGSSPPPTPATVQVLDKADVDLGNVSGDAFVDKTFNIYGGVSHRGLRTRFLNEGVRVTEALAKGYGDNLEDDLQSLIDDRVADNGGKLIIDGIFYTNPINLRGTTGTKVGLVIEGLGRWRTGLIANPGVLESQMLIRASGGGGFEIRDLFINCDKAHQNGGVMPEIIDPNYEKYGGVWFYNECENPIIERLRVIDAPLIGVSSGAPHLAFGGVKNFRAYDIIYQGCGGAQSGMRMDGGWSIGLTLLDFGGVGVMCDYGSRGHQISHVRAVGRGKNISGNAVFTYQADDIMISHVDAQACSQAVCTAGVSQRATISHVHGHNLQSGVRFHENSGLCSLVGFGFRDVDFYGVVSYGSRRCSVSQGSIQNAGYSGVAGLFDGGTIGPDEFQLDHVDIADSGGAGVYVQNAARLSLDTVTIRNSSKGAAGTYPGVQLESVVKAALSNVRAIDDQATHTQTTGLKTVGTVTLRAEGGELSGGALLSAGTVMTARDVEGYVSAVSGVQSFGSSEVGRTIAHGLSQAPPFGLVEAHFIGAPGNAGTVSIRNINNATFDLFLNVAPGTPINVGWSARLSS